MAKYSIQKGDKINARTSLMRDENNHNIIIGGHTEINKPLTVKEVFSHGVSTKEHGYIHNNNIISKEENKVK